MDYKKDDINLQTAINAHNAISFYPEKSGEQIQVMYCETMKDIIAKIDLLAITSNQKAIAEIEFIRFKDGYINKFNNWLTAKSRTMSAMITGPAKFPTSRNRNRIYSEQKCYSELLEFEEKALRAIEKKLKAQEVEDKGGIIEVTKKELAALIAKHQKMKDINKVLKKKNQTIEETSKILKKDFNFKDSTIKELLKPDYAGRIGFPSFSVSSTNLKIKRLKTKIEQLEKIENSTEKDNKVEFYKDIKIIRNISDNRLQLFFEGKPSNEIRTKLKSRGFRWSPKNICWQRVLTNNALYSLKYLIREL